MVTQVEREGTSPNQPRTAGHGAPALKHWALAAVVVAVGTIIRLAAVVALASPANPANPANPARTLGERAAGLGELLSTQLTQWDAVYYTEIARAGYFGAAIASDGPIHEKTLAFFPGFPMLLRVINGVTGMDEAAAAFLANAAFTVALAAGVMALQYRAGLWAPVAAAFVVTGAPMAIVFAMPYTEALFGALAVWALVHLCDRRWWAAGLLIALAGTVRLTAVVLLLAMAAAIVAAIVDTRGYAARGAGAGRWGHRQAWAWLFLAALPLPAYIAWADAHLGGAGGYFAIQREHWNSGFDFGAASVRWVRDTLSTPDNVGYLLTTAVMVAAPVAIALSARRLPLPVAVLCIAVAAMVLCSDGIMHSRPRLLLPAALAALPLVDLAFRRLPPAASWTLTAAWVLGGAWFSAYMLVVFEWAI